jgi:hypothetical protein
VLTDSSEAVFPTNHYGPVSEVTTDGEMEPCDGPGMSQPRPVGTGPGASPSGSPWEESGVSAPSPKGRRRVYTSHSLRLQQLAKRSGDQNQRGPVAMHGPQSQESPLALAKTHTDSEKHELCAGTRHKARTKQE